MTIRLLTVIVVGLLWFCLTREQSSLERLIFPSIEGTLLVFAAQWETWLYSAFVTLQRIVIGYVAGMCLGIVTGLSMLAHRVLGEVLDVLIEGIRPVPPIALTPFFILWFGVGDLGQWLLIGMAVFLVFAVSTAVSGKNVNQRYLRAAEALGVTQWGRIRTVLFPAIIPDLAAAARVAAAAAFAVSIAAEYLGAQGGLGFMIRNARITLQTDAILVAIILLGFMSYLCDFGIRRAFAYWTEWVPREEQRDSM